ncbi:hypothetical protein PAESOLCIP111_00443 [Paenibacillus solanacearum]|uniref:Spore germination protein n=1 Tax=Paenibacillus solanacearum TaxID=2048548 RepID=A0A916JV06_9BACL|nr:hypothetical protein [Paenibacillus solanacearum]CAG7600981.1 hypothetical protein PAESOLCIP111_00443 [Paenibacillus solanacearum]
MPVSVVFNAINVLSMSVNSIIASGQNSQPNWETQGKLNSGNGVYMNSIVVGSINVINDQDLMDSPFTQPEVINPQPVTQL